MQTSTSSSTYLSTAATRFIPTTQIQDIVIHEAFKGFEVRFYLAVIVEGEPDVLVVFPVSQLFTGPMSRTNESRFPRNCFQSGRYLRRFGEAHGAVFMMPSHDTPRVVMHV